jgi:hypothetical protein
MGKVFMNADDITQELSALRTVPNKQTYCLRHLQSCTFNPALCSVSVLTTRI